jgi:hypothetical protein
VITRRSCLIMMAFNVLCVVIFAIIATMFALSHEAGIACVWGAGALVYCVSVALNIATLRYTID